MYLCVGLPTPLSLPLCVCLCVCVCARARARVCVCAYVHVCVRACVRMRVLCVRVWEGGYLYSKVTLQTNPPFFTQLCCIFLFSIVGGGEGNLKDFQYRGQLEKKSIDIIT